MVVAAAIAFLGTVVTVTGGLILARMLRPSDLIDQLQEERSTTDSRLTKAERRIETLSFRQRYYEDYVNELRGHIERGNPPPPPPYPVGLLRIDMEAPA